jgi:hypothetical protein
VLSASASAWSTFSIRCRRTQPDSSCDARQAIVVGCGKLPPGQARCSSVHCAVVGEYAGGGSQRAGGHRRCSCTAWLAGNARQLAALDPVSAKRVQRGDAFQRCSPVHRLTGEP